VSAFRLVAPFEPTGDQPQAIEALCRSLAAGNRFQVLEGVTGSGKTYTMANVIARLGLPALVISHNKTLAAQLYGEFREFFPDNAVEYFVSYYDYYQPEAYIPQTDTYIEKDASINEEIERMRLSATNSLLSRRDVVIVASVSCIYGLGSPEDYEGMVVRVARGDEVDREQILARLVDIQYTRNDIAPSRGTFRVRGDVVEVYPPYGRNGIRIELDCDVVGAVSETDPLTGDRVREMDVAVISPARHFVMPEPKIKPAMARIVSELDESVTRFEREGKLLEAQRIHQRTMYDMEMIREIGYCSGIENYSRHLSGRSAGEPPATLLDYFGGEFLTIIDESHATLPQLRGMYNGDQARKQVLVDHGFRLPSAKDNRPLRMDEFMRKVGRVIFASATPGEDELSMAPVRVEQLIRPTGLTEPPVEVRPLENQVDDLMAEVKEHAARSERVLVTTLTKRTAEDLARYLREAGLRVEHIHSDMDALERVRVLRRLREGKFDCLVGINLLREGLDLPEVALVAILDADKEGFLRSERSLIQVAGRTARHLNGKVILYAAGVTDSMRRMLDATDRRRRIQTAYNAEHGITPRGVERALQEMHFAEEDAAGVEAMVVREAGGDYDVALVISEMEREMIEAADALEYERAAHLRDQIAELRHGTGTDGDAGRGTGPRPAGARSRKKPVTGARAGRSTRSSRGGG